jgi:hypothetical protein
MGEEGYRAQAQKGSSQVTPPVFRDHTEQDFSAPARLADTRELCAHTRSKLVFIAGVKMLLVWPMVKPPAASVVPAG